MKGRPRSGTAFLRIKQWRSKEDGALGHERGPSIFDPLLLKSLVKQFRADVGECRPGDQDRRDEGEHAEDTHDGDCVAGFDGIDDVGCAGHDLSPLGVARSRCEASVNKS